MSNEISVTSTQTPSGINGFFGNIDFNKLSASIQALADRKTNLSCIEKKSASEIIDEWNRNVLDKIRAEEGNIEMFLNAIMPSQGQNFTGVSSLIQSQAFIPELEFLIDKANVRDKYEELEDIMYEYDAAKAAAANRQAVVHDTATTVESEIIQRKDIELENIRKTAAITKIGNKIAKLNSEITAAIGSDKEIVKSLRLLKRKCAEMKKAELKCSDVAQLAKINVTIDDADIRDTLREIINFSLK